MPDIIGQAPYVNDDTRSWVENNRVNNQIKPAFIFRAATDANYINNQVVSLPAYKNQPVFSQSISNILSPGQRIPGVLSWSVTESLENTTQTASLEVADALPISTISTTITGFGVGTKGDTITSISSLPARWNSTTIRSQWVRGGDYIIVAVKGDKALGTIKDPTIANNPPGYPTTYREENLLYRIFEPEIIQCDPTTLANFPDPAVPLADEDVSLGGTSLNDWWDIDRTGSLRGIGAYYILVGTEVMRVTKIDRTTNRIFIVPGGRGAAGTITSHAIGDTVQLLGLAPFSGKWTAFGYLMPRDFKLTQSPMRPGTCYTSYEGYGAAFNPSKTNTGSLSKVYNRANNMCFTGYWFVSSPQATLDDTGTPKLLVTLQSCGYVVNEQKITPNTVQRSQNTFSSWAKATFDEVGHQRAIPGSWLDFNNWDPTLPGSYPLKILTEYAQHKAFFDHMGSTDMGAQCAQCRQEWLDYIAGKEHNHPTGSIAEARAVGKHIYKESIMVFNAGGQFNAGPLKTFGRLMTALAIAAWENPLEGTTLGTRWSKMPNQLFNNMNSWMNGRVWNGQLGFEFSSETTTFDFSNQTHQDEWVMGTKVPLKCAFESTYDRQPFVQPILDLADLNRMTFTFTREGYPVFIPTGKKLRGLPSSSVPHSPTHSGEFTDARGHEIADPDTGRGEWFLSYGGSISNYSHTIDASGVLTLVYVSCTTAFDEITFTIPAAGTGLKQSNIINENTSEKLVWYSSEVGNKEGLQMTSGVHQVDTVSLENVNLGLDWNTKPASWGLTLKRGPDNLTQVDAQPPIPYPNGLDLYRDSKTNKSHPGIIIKIQKFINFMMERRYIGPAVFDQAGRTLYPLSITEDGLFGPATESGVKNIQAFMAGQGAIGIYKYVSIGSRYQLQSTDGTYWDPLHFDNTGTWSNDLATIGHAWLSANSEYIKTDVWWYVQNGLPWDQYVGAVAGLAIPQVRDASVDGKWLIDQLALQTEANDWMKQFFKDAVNYGNQIVDDSINKATQKSVQTNLADPRIQLGDIIWASIPGYMDSSNKFGAIKPPFGNGIYVTSITRTLSLQEASYTATYAGYRYRGLGESGVMDNPSNYCSRKRNEV